jgi:trigger factor
VTGQSPDVLIAQMRAEAAQSVARELVLEAVADRAGIEISDDDVKALIREQAEDAEDDAEQVIEDVWAHGHQESLREDLRLRAALDRLAADVKPISVDLAEARDKLWTPDKENTEPEKKLWTPGSKEPE